MSLDPSLYAYDPPDAPAVVATDLVDVLRRLAASVREALAAAEEQLEGAGATPAEARAPPGAAFLQARAAAAALRREDAVALLHMLSSEMQAEMARSLALAKAATAAHARRGGLGAAQAVRALAALRSTAAVARAEAADAVMRELQARRLLSAADHAIYLQRTLDAAAAGRL